MSWVDYYEDASTNTMRRLTSGTYNTGNSTAGLALSLITSGIDSLCRLYEDAGGYNGSWNCTDIDHANEYWVDIATEINNVTCVVHHSEVHIPAGVYIVLYCAFILFLGCVFKYFQHRFHIPIPYTVILLIAGILMEIWEIYRPNAFGKLNEGFQDVRVIDAHMILIIFIPGLIFESAFNTNWHIFLKEVQQATMLAGPGVIINVILSGGVMHYFARTYNWDWSFCFMFGAIVSATDPVAVVALLKELGASKRLSTLIEAESLLNDGTAYVIFILARDFAKSDEANTFSSVVIKLLRLAVGGVTLGVLFGIFTYWSISQIFSDHEIEITITLSLAYLAFYTGDIALGVSGVLTCVFMGLWVSKNRSAVSPNVEETMHHFWELLGFIANTILFFATGQIIAYRISIGNVHNHINFGTDVLILIMLYISLHISRGLAIWQMFPVLQNTGYGCTFPDAVIMVYGGLRGAIGLALALIVETTPSGSAQQDPFEQIEKDRVLFHVCGIVTLTLIVNASTIKYLVNYLGLNKPPEDTAALFKATTDHLYEETHHYLNNKMKFDKHYNGANWTKVEELQPNYSKLYENIFANYIIENEVQQSLKNDENSTMDIRDDSDIEHSKNVMDYLEQIKDGQREMNQKKEVENRLIQVMKSSYWAQFEKGLISGDTVSILVEAADNAMDDNNLTLQIKALKKYFTIPSYIKWLYSSHFKVVKKIAERLLYNNLGLAIELSSGMIFAAEKAKEFGHILKKGESMNVQHVDNTIHQLHAVQQWITKSSDQVENVYPDVHSAIKTSHAAHALLHHQEKTLLHLFHKGHLDDAEYEQLDKLIKGSLNKLFHTGYNTLLSGRSDENILLQSPLFSELTIEQRKLVRHRKEQSDWYKKGDDIIREGDRTKKIFVITRGTVGVYESDMRRTQRRTTNSIIKFGLSEEHSTERLNGIDFNATRNRSFGIETKVYTHEQGSIIDVYPLLQQTCHNHTFRVEAEPCHGYWLDTQLLAELKDLNIDFWDTIWKYSAVDVIRYYFASESDAFQGHDLSDLHEKVFSSPLGYFEPHENKLKKCQIRITKGVGILLTGSVAILSQINEPYDAPAVLKPIVQPYIAFSQCVVLYLDFKRGEIKQNIELLNPKLAKLMGGNVVDIGLNEDEFIDSETEYSDDSYADSLSDSESIDSHNEKDTDKAKDKDNYKDKGKDKGKDKRTHIVVDDDEKTDDKHEEKKNETKEDKSNKKRTHLQLTIRESRLPNKVASNMINNWSFEESFEVAKYIINKHDSLAHHLQSFQVANKQHQIKAIRKSKRFTHHHSIFAKPKADDYGTIDGFLNGKLKDGTTSQIPKNTNLVRHQSRFRMTQQKAPSNNRLISNLSMNKTKNKGKKNKGKKNKGKRISKLKKKAVRKTIVISSKYHSKQSKRAIYDYNSDDNNDDNNNKNKMDDTLTKIDETLTKIDENNMQGASKDTESSLNVAGWQVEKFTDNPM